MFLAFASSLRSADMSRQVGAVIAKDREIISTGANDCPTFGGGLYWPEYNPEKNVERVEDKPVGRDYKRGTDCNKAEQQKIINQILEKANEKGIDAAKLSEVLQESRITELTEFGRAVHAEMEALLACSRRGVSIKGATLYCTTFPCHNCAKHIIAAGIHRVVYIEPYEKSKAEELHSDAMKVGFSETPIEQEGLVRFEPFVGVGPRRFLDLFSMGLGSGYRLKREDERSNRVTWTPEDSSLRIQMLPLSYLETEVEASILFNKQRIKLRENDNGVTGNNGVRNGTT
jgi:deoxycytidylate deaminase